MSLFQLVRNPSHYGLTAEQGTIIYDAKEFKTTDVREEKMNTQSFFALSHG
jgi:hypothetical protein